MSLSYDTFTFAFLDKISEYDFINLEEFERQEIIDRYMKTAIANFKKNCKYDLSGTYSDADREFAVEIADEDIDEIIDIVSDGMVVQWMKPFVYKQENLQNVLNTKDFTTYSPAELLMRIGNAYKSASQEFTQKIREYSYNHADLSDLHL